MVWGLQYAGAIMDAGSRSESSFLRLLHPQIASTIKVVTTRLRELNAPEESCPLALETLEESLAEALYSRLLQALTKPAVLELHIARISGHLVGDDPKSRFASFVELLSDRTYRENFLKEYPVMVRICQKVCNQWIVATLAFLERFRTDRHTLSHVFSIQQSDTLRTAHSVSVECHNKGGMVLKLQFESGAEVFYNPRSMKVSSEFYRFISWLNSRGQQPALSVPICLDKGAYGDRRAHV